MKLENWKYADKYRIHSFLYKLAQATSPRLMLKQLQQTGWISEFRLKKLQYNKKTHLDLSHREQLHEMLKKINCLKMVLRWTIKCELAKNDFCTS